MSRRRTFLKSLGLGAGASMLGPLLGRIAAEPTGSTPRFVFVLEGNGVNPGNFLSSAARAAINGAGGSVDAGQRVTNTGYRHDAAIDVSAAGLDDALALGSLGPDAGDSLLEHAMVVLGLSNEVAGGGHTSNYGALSCSPSRVRIPSHATIDHLLAQVPGVRQATPFDVVRLGIHPESHLNYNTCATGSRAPAPIVCDPTTAFYALFGSVAPGAGARSFADRRDLLDFIRSDAEAALGAFSGSSGERQKVEHYLAAVETLTARHETIDGMGAELAAAAPDGPGVSPLYDSTHHLDELDAMFELATASLIGCLTNVVVIASGTGERGYNLPYTSLGLESPGRHGICHANDFDTLTRVTERHVSLVARMARALMAVPEGDGTMLDHTILVYGSDNGEKHHSKAEEWPLLVVGGSRVGMGVGDRTVVYPGHGRAENRQLSNFYNTLGYLAGEPLEEFGEDTRRIAAGPLADLMS